MQYDRSKTDWVDHPEDVWVVSQTGRGIIGAASTDQGSSLIPEIDRAQPFHVTKTTLHRPSLRAVYGGPTLIEALWNEMDDIMERLMTGTESEDGGDKYRAQELAWVLAIVTNAYDPSVDRIRAEAMERWNRAQDEPAGGSTLNREEQGR